MEIRVIGAAETRPLRQAVLRPHQAVETLVYPGDDLSETLHVGAFEAGILVGIASVYHEAAPETNNPGAWRLRGMAIAPAVQRQGYGAALIAACVAYVAREAGTLLWCNARTTAAPFYVAQGFVIEGDEYELAGLGPHVLMVRAIGAAKEQA